MFNAQDSERGRPRGQSSSWGSGDWNTGYGNTNPDYGGRTSNTSRLDDRDKFRNQGQGQGQGQGFGRSHEQEEPSNSNIVCQNYLQNKCMRGSSCLFRHPPSSGSTSRPSSSSNSKKQQNAWLNFCSSFQKGQCPFSDDCRLLHVAKRDENEYRSTGDIPTNVVEQAMSKAMVMDWAYIGNQPHCKEYLQGACHMRGCNFRHLNTDQYVVEVLAALREKFQMTPEEMFPEKSWGGSRVGANTMSRNQEVNQYGGTAQSPPTQSGRNNYGSSGDNYEPDTKRMRPQESSKYQMDDRRQTRPLDDIKRQNVSQGSAGYPPGSADDDFLDSLRRDNIEITKTNEDVKGTSQKLEDENGELRKALRLALDLNSHARNLQEFRNHLRDIQASLKKRGYQQDDNSNTGSWNSGLQMEPTMSSSQDNRMYGGGGGDQRSYSSSGGGDQRSYSSSSGGGGGSMAQGGGGGGGGGSRSYSSNMDYNDRSQDMQRSSGPSRSFKTRW